MDIATVTASIAGICMAICQIPQVLLVYRNKNANGVSLLMQCTLTTGIFMWFTTGILLNNPPMYLSNGLCLLCCLYILYYCIKNKALPK